MTYLLIARLSLRALLLLAIGIQAFIVSTMPGQAADYLYYPQDGAEISGNTPTIRFTIPRNFPLDSPIRFIVNEKDVTDQILRINSSIFYTPAAPLCQGINKVEVYITDKNGEETYKSWEFFISPERLISCVDHDAEDFLMEGQSINITVKGRPGCRGSVDIDQLYKNIPLVEMEPGTYIACQKVTRGDNIDRGVITARLNCGNSKDEMISCKNVTMQTSMFKVIIDEPKHLQPVGQTFVIRGRTKPNTRVHFAYRLGIEINRTLVPLGVTGSDVVYSNSDGTFCHKLSFPIGMKRLYAQVTVWALDDRGERSVPDETLVMFKCDKKPDNAENIVKLKNDLPHHVEAGVMQTNRGVDE